MKTISELKHPGRVLGVIESRMVTTVEYLVEVSSYDSCLRVKIKRSMEIQELGP